MAFSQDLNPAKAALLIFLQQKFYEWAYCDQIVLTCSQPNFSAAASPASEGLVQPIAQPQQHRDLQYERRLRRQFVPLGLREQALSLERIAVEASEARRRYR